MSKRLALSDIVTYARQFRSCFVPNPGNAGDALIALGTYHWFDGWKEVLPTPISITQKHLVKDFDLVIYGGGGNLVPFYEDALSLIRYAVELGKEVVVLPHTILGCEGELLRLASRLKVFCREKTSYETLIAAGMPADRLGLEADMGLRIDPNFLAHYDRDPREEIAYCMRTDQESRDMGISIRPDNQDISLCWNGDFWHDRPLVEAVAGSLMAYLSRFETIVTDRLHIAILAALLGRKIRMVANSYFKNRAVYEFSIKDRFSNVVFVD